jgi:hypothetical protein
MPHHTSLIALLCVGFVMAFALGMLAQRLKLSPLVGYLLAGVIVGPFTPGFVADQTLAPQLAEVGVILLMFGVGLHFSLRDLLDVKNIAVPGALLQIAFVTSIGTGLRPDAGLGPCDGQHRVRAIPVGGQHRGGAAGDGRSPAAGYPARAHRDRLADRRGPGDGAGAGAAARHRRGARGWRESGHGRHRSARSDGPC